MKKATAVLEVINRKRPAQVSNCELPVLLKNLLSGIIRQRIRLVESGASKKNEALCRKLIEKYKPYCYYHFTEVGAAKFLLRHLTPLRYLIPERAKSSIEQLGQLARKAENILTPKLFDL